MDFVIPEYVTKVITVLQEAGFEAYIVGGAVRDLLLRRQPEDYDIASNARPDEIKLVARRAGFGIVDELGQNFGVMLLTVDKHPVEVASFRNETYGADAHRPSEVWYCDTLREDLGRRDFTINAMAFDGRGNIIDLFGGQEDLRSKILRTVGNADKRFDEDALRMFRACRFIAQLGFSADEKIKKAITRSLFRVQGLSLERVRTELDKLLCGEYAAQGLELLIDSGLAGESCRRRMGGEAYKIPILPEVVDLVGLKQNPNYHCYDVCEHTLKAVSKGDRSLEVEWALLLHDIGKGREGVRGVNANGEPTDHNHENVGADMTVAILQRLGYTLPMVQRVEWLVRNHMRFGFNSSKSDATMLRWLRKTAREGPFRTTKEMAEAFKQLTAVCIADLAATNAHEQELISAQMFGKKLIINAYEMPVHTNDLNVSGKDIRNIVPEQKELGLIMQILLQRVQDGSLKNCEGALLSAAGSWHDRN